MYPKITQKFTKHPTTSSVHAMSVEFLDCSKRERDISIKAMSSGGKMAFRLNTPLSNNISKKRQNIKQCMGFFSQIEA